MYGPPLDPRDRSPPNHPTWRSVVACYAVAAAFPLALWTASSPLAGAVALVAVAGLFVVVRRAYGLVRCLRHCRAMAFEVTPNVRVTVTWRRVDDLN